MFNLFKKKKVLVVGTGLIGSFVVNTLSKLGLKVYAVDTNSESLDNCNISSCQKNVNLDLMLSNIKPDIAVNAVPGSIGLKMLDKLLNNYFLDVVDFSFMPENPTLLPNKAQKICLTDFGVAPGISHIMVEYIYQLSGTNCNITIEVGGLPLDSKDTRYKAVFSPKDVIEEYTRPARYINDGKITYENPFSVHYLSHLGDGFSSFVSDGLRSLLKNVPVNNLKEFTTRSTNHFNEMKVLKDYGFFNKENIDKTCEILLDKWKMEKNFKDRTIMVVEGINPESDSFEEITLKLSDEHDGKNHSMARSTGLPVVAAVNYILENKSTINPGIYEPEIFYRDNNDFFKFVINFLRENGINISINFWKD